MIQISGNKMVIFKAFIIRQGWGIIRLIKQMI